MVVEYIRSSYVGRWRLYHARPDILVRGRYVVAPPGTPAFPDFHRLGSASWLPNGIDVDPLLGPADTPRRVSWYSGAAPEPYPNAGPVGDTAGLLTGFRYPQDVAPLVISGYPADCWQVVAQGVPDNVWGVFPGHEDPPTWIRLAQLIDLAYDFPSQAVDLALSWGALSATVVGGDSDWMPRTFFADFGSWQLFWSAGSNPDQLALQAMSAGLGPQPWGSLRVLLLHGQAADLTINRLEALGYDPGRPLLLTGHSYGGIIAALVAIRIQDADPDRVLRVVSFGMPKVGDAPSALHISTVPSTHLVNRGDPVPELPPSLGIVSALLPVQPPEAGPWADWHAPPVGRTILAADGTRVRSQANPTGWADYLAAINAAVLGDPIPLTAAHDIKEYLARLVAGQ